MKMEISTGKSNWSFSRSIWYKSSGVDEEQMIDNQNIQSWFDLEG